MRFELVPLDQIGALAGFYLVSCTPAAGHCTSVDQRSPPRHALSRVLTPTTNPSRTGMMVATRRRSCAARRLKAGPPRGLAGSSLAWSAAAWDNALFHESRPPRRR